MRLQNIQNAVNIQEILFNKIHNRAQIWLIMIDTDAHLGQREIIGDPELNPRHHEVQSWQIKKI